MKFLKKAVLPIAMLGLFGVSSNQAFAADSLTGKVDVSMTLTSSCLINGGEVSEGEAFGKLDFGTQISLFSSATASIKGGGGSLLTIKCNAENGSAPKVSLVSGANDSHAAPTYNHAMVNGSSYISYSLYKDSTYTTAIAPNSTFFTSNNDGSVETVAVYAKAVGAAGLAIGSYSDTLTLKIDF